MQNYPEILTPVLSFVVGVLGPVLIYFNNRRQTKTERATKDNELKLAKVTATQAATDNLIEQLQEEIERLHAENSALRADLNRYRDDITDYRIGSDRLIGQLEQLGDEPRWRPPTRPRPSIDDYLPKKATD